MKNLKLKLLIFLMAWFVLLAGCNDDEESVVTPTVTTTSETKNITPATATSGGNVTADGGASITARGVCWNTSSNPTIANDTTMNGIGIGNFTSNITGLISNTVYFVRAYATNEVGTTYGNEITFKTLEKFIGTYVISNASLATIITLSTNQMGTIQVPIGTDITEAIQKVLLSSVNCSSASKSYIELRKDHSIYMSCELKNPFNAGIWEKISETSLKLNLNSSAIPSSQNGFVLTVIDIVEGPVSFTGKTSVPLPKSMIAGMIAPLILSASSPEIYQANISLTFLRK